MATTPFVYACDKEAGFVLDPDEQQRVGYLTALTIGTTQLAKDLQVQVPAIKSLGFTGLGPLKPPPLNQTNSTAGVVGVLDKFSWEGGIGNPLSLEFWVSQQNATHLKAAQQAALETTIVNSLSWWIINYDQETKQWYEQSFPAAPAAISGIIAGKDNPELNVDLTGAPAKDGIDVVVYKVALTVSPPANHQYTLQFASAPQKNVAKAWGLVVS